MESSKENIEAQLCAYVEGELDDAQRAEIEQHLTANPQHKALIAELRAASGLLRDPPRVKADRVKRIVLRPDRTFLAARSDGRARQGGAGREPMAALHRGCRGVVAGGRIGIGGLLCFAARRGERWTRSARRRGQEAETAGWLIRHGFGRSRRRRAFTR